MSSQALSDVFDEDYRFFDELRNGTGSADVDASAVASSLKLAPGMRVLDVGCGYGRIANRLAARGCRVTGIDTSRVLLDVARAAAPSPLAVFLERDMRHLGFVNEFDRAFCWFTSFGYGTDDESRAALAQVAAALVADGQFLLEVVHKDYLLVHLRAEVVQEREDNILIDAPRYDAATGRMNTRRTIVRGGRVRHAQYSLRLFAFPEIRDWLLTSGFRKVEAVTGEGQPLTLDTPRLVVLASR